MHQIQSKTGLWKSTIGIIDKETNGDKGWRLDNAVEATHFIKNIFPDPITLPTVRNALKQTTFTML